MYIKRHILAVAVASVSVLTASLSASAASLQFDGSPRKIIEVTPDRNTGLDMIYVVYDVAGVSASFTSTSSTPARWYKYSNLGGGYAVELTDIVYSGNTSTLPQIEGDMGYIIECGTDRSYFWVTGYKPHELRLQSVSVSPESDCGMTILDVNGSADPIHYYTINGQQRTLDRDITVEYLTLEADREARVYNQIQATHSIESIDASGHVYISPAPLCDTRFTVSGDAFMRAWGSYLQVRSDSYTTPAVDCFVFATQTPRNDSDEPSNEIGSGEDGTLGGSAPAEITFTAIASDAVLHNEWQFSDDPEFSNLTYRFNDAEVSHTFREEGTTYVRYIGSNADGSCETYGETFEVHIGNSELKIPNAFSPGASEGTNDIWKVSYRSIIEFECHIFNIQGEEIFSFNDPSQGWDGKKGGKLVKPGVYYYVIEALGSDGKRYKKSGDINIVRYTRRASGTGGGSSTTE